jgi:hypothetical protein
MHKYFVASAHCGMLDFSKLGLILLGLTLWILHYPVGISRITVQSIILYLVICGIKEGLLPKSAQATLRPHKTVSYMPSHDVSEWRRNS